MKLYDEWEAIANRTIPRAKKVDKIIKQNYTTGDIIRDVLDTFAATKDQLKDFAPTLKGPDDKTTCSNIWHFIKVHLNYKVDPAGVQWVRTPARLWQDDIGDCKSFSLFAASLLHALGIPGFFRFVSFSDTNTNPTHVYVVATPSPAHHYPIDAVISSFNRETPFKHKIDYDMSSLYTLSGIGEVPKLPRKGELQIPVMADGTTTDELISAAIVKQRLELEQAMTARVAGIGDTTVSVYDDAINMVSRDIEALKADATVNGVYEDDGYSYDPEVGSIFKKIGNGIKSVAKAVAKPVAKAATAVAKGTVKVVKTAANVVKKVVTLPLRGLAEIAIPKAAMSFLYMFVKNEAIVAKLPPKVQDKRNKQNRLAKTICDIISMKRDHFDGIVRNGIMKKTGKTPEAYMSELMGFAVSGIGIAPAILASLAGPLLDLLQMIMSMFGKKPEDSPEEASPAPDDFDGMVTLQRTRDSVTDLPVKTSEQEQYNADAATHLQKKGSKSTLASLLAKVKASGALIHQVQQTFAASQQQPAVLPGEKTSSDGSDLPPVYTSNPGSTAVTYGDPTGSGYAQVPDVRVTAPRRVPIVQEETVEDLSPGQPAPANPVPETKDNTMLLVGGGLAALYLLTQSGGRR